MVYDLCDAAFVLNRTAVWHHGSGGTLYTTCLLAVRERIHTEMPLTESYYPHTYQKIFYRTDKITEVGVGHANNDLPLPTWEGDGGVTAADDVPVCYYLRDFHDRYEDRAIPLFII